MDKIHTLSDQEYQRIQQRQQPDTAKLWQLLDAVKDPELPVISIWDLGILRDIHREHDAWVITITPTYSGCPAMEPIKKEIASVLASAGFNTFKIITRLSPAWNSEWISTLGRQQLNQFGVAPPVDDANIRCPHCGSKHTHVISEFGSTSCKALCQCLDCLEPFDYFKKI